MTGLIWEITNWLKWRPYLRASETHRQIKAVLDGARQYRNACRGRWVIDEVTMLTSSDSPGSQVLLEEAAPNSERVRQVLAAGHTLCVVQVRNKNREGLQPYPSARGHGFRFYVDLEAKTLIFVSCDPWFT